MAKKKEKQPQEHTIVELKAQCEEMSRKLYDLKNEYKLNRKLDQPHLLKKYRKDIARALTAINMKKSEKKES